VLWPLRRDDVARLAAALEADGAICSGTRSCPVVASPHSPLGRRLRAGLDDDAMRAAIAAARDVPLTPSR
jgi:hypothetical protein